MTVAFLAAIFSTFHYRETVALLSSSASAGFTDYLDGKIAARNNLVTNFGIMMDPLADKIMVCSAFIAFVGLGWIDAWMVVLIVARELAITGLRLLAASKLVSSLQRKVSRKHKTISQIAAIIRTILVYHSYTEWGGLGASTPSV